MNNLDLGLIIRNGQVVVSSRDVAFNYGKRHADVLRDIRNIIEMIPQVNERHFSLVNYSDSKGEERPMYLLDRQGFSILVMGFTGKKAKQFTYKYTNAFEEMAQELLQPKSKSIEDLIIMQAQSMKEVKAELAATKNQVNQIKETIINHNENWRKDITKQLRKIGLKHGDFKKFVDESYKILEERAGCDLHRRLENLRQRMALEGATKTAIGKANYLDVISLDKRLREIYIGIVARMYVKYAA